jgi:tetratricopeptide (TPR) repeat protein
MRRRLTSELILLAVAAQVMQAVSSSVLFAAPSTMEASGQILLVARDREGHPLSGICFAHQGTVSRPTTRKGKTVLDLARGHHLGEQVEIQQASCSPSKPAEEWILLATEINIPGPTDEVVVVLMRRSVYRKIAAEARDAALARAQGAEAPSVGERRGALAAAAARQGLSLEQGESALRSFAQTQDPMDRGIQAYLEGKYSQAEELLGGVTAKQEQDLIARLLYLGAAQQEQGKYPASVESFRKALALRGDDAVLLSWLGVSLMRLAEWTEGEAVLRRALAIDEQTHGPDHYQVAEDLNNLALLLKATNRLGEAEPLMRQALAIDEKAYGPDDPVIATRLNNLAALLEDTTRLGEAEPLMRRAIAIGEKSYGPEDSLVATFLNNLGKLLLDTNRLGEAEPLLRRAQAIEEKVFGPEDHPMVAICLNNLAQVLQAEKRPGEAEPLMRRALAIDEKIYGPNHPFVATRLNNLAALLKATARLEEAEQLLRRALAIDEKSYGPDHPDVARDLNNLAQLLHATHRLEEAEPLMRRALAIDEKSDGPDHPDVAIDLNNLARLLQALNRLGEAEPLMRRAVSILFGFQRRSGHEHLSQSRIVKNYRDLLGAMGRSPAEVDAAITALRQAP